MKEITLSKSGSEKEQNINQNIAIALLIRYEIFDFSIPSNRSFSNFNDFESAFGLKKQFIKDFLNGRQKGKVHRQSSNESQEDYKKLVQGMKKRWQDKLADTNTDYPHFVQALFDEIVEPNSKRMLREHEETLARQRDEEAEKRSGEFEEIVDDVGLDKIAKALAECIDDSAPATRRRLAKLSGRFYDIFRWTASAPETSNNTQSPAEAHVIRAALRFYYHKPGSSVVSFALKYHPYQSDDARSISDTNATYGYAIPIGNSFCLIGRESSSYPVIIFLDADTTNFDNIGGLVLRRSDKEPRLFASRVVFRVNTTATQLKDLDEELRIIPESQLKEIDPTVHQILQEFVNDTGETSKQGLTLKKF